MRSSIVLLKKFVRIALACFIVTLAACGGGSDSSGTGGQPPATVAKTAIPNSTLYPRVIRLSHAPAASNGKLIASAGGIFQSSDNGSTFTPLSTVAPVAGSTEPCCATLYELPVAVGALPAGTLLRAGTYRYNGTPAIEIYTSNDQGATWNYYDTPVIRGAGKQGGEWEPEFTVANDGALVMFWSDETDPCCSQKLAQMRTYDGKTWQDASNTVNASTYAPRPGMARVSKLPDGHFFMSYEICGPQSCVAYSRTSIDGWNFGTPTNLGTPIASTTGQYFEHAPSSVWSPKGGANGSLIAVGQVLHEADGSVSPRNGQVLFVNASADGAGAWTVEPAPVPVPTAHDDPCPNYSDALLPSVDGTSLLQLASDYNASNVCQTYYGILPQ
jgi:hypothetical protein